MKLKTALVMALFATVGFSNAAVYGINNIVTVGNGDRLYANKDNVLSSGSIVTLGYFTVGFNVSSSLGDIATLLSNYTSLASGLTGNVGATLGVATPGYAEYADVTGATITSGNPLLGQPVYSFVGNAATLSGSTQYALIQLGVFQDDNPSPQTYSSNPAPGVPIIGTIGAYNGDLGGGPSTFSTLKTAIVVPETSTALLGALGALGLLRRRR